MGAEVIKVEAPRGDSNRSLGAHHSKGMAALYLTCNRNKRSLVLDLKQDSGREALLKIVADVDVLVHNNRPQVMTRLGIDYEQLKDVNPKLIYCGSYGYGKDGPYGARGALDDSIQAASGIAMLQKMVLGRTALFADRGRRQDDGDGRRVCRDIGAVSARKNRCRSGTRSADVRNHGLLRYGRASVGHDVRAAAWAPPATSV